MTNPVYNLTVQALQNVPSGAVEIINAALAEIGTDSEKVTANQMQRAIAGPMLKLLSEATSVPFATNVLQSLSSSMESIFPSLPDLEPEPSSPTEDLSADDFEFDDPELGATLSKQFFALSTADGQEDLIKHLGRMQGVQGVLISNQSGAVLRSKAIKDVKALSAVIAAASMIFKNKNLKLMSADMGSQTVCMLPVESYCVSVIAGQSVNIGRLLGELQQVGISQ